MSVSDEEAMKAANRVRTWEESLDKGDEESHEYYDSPHHQVVDEHVLTDWAVEELDSRDRESSDRAKPINATLLMDSGGASIGTAWFWPGVPGRYESGVWMIGHEKIRDVRDHGDLLDVLKGLKGESK